MRAVDLTENHTVYGIHNDQGRLVANHHRVDKPDGTKQFWWEKDGAKGLNGTRLADLPLYGSELVRDRSPDGLIVLVEGEKARDALEAVGIHAVGTVTGAGGTPGYGALEVLRGHEVTLWPDADEAGREHMRHIAERLQDMGCEVRWYEWPEAPEKGDAADHPAIQGRKEKAVDQLLNELMCAPAWQPEERNGKVSYPMVGRLLSEVTAEQVWWLWAKRIPLGKLTVIDGDPGLGKSVLLTDAAARVSVGRPWPDGSPCVAGGVVICSAEDGLADTIRPRLDAAGGDPSKVLALATVPDEDGERLLSIPEDLDVIRRGIERVDAKLVIVDPIMSFLSESHNAHKDQDVRRALAPLAKLAEDTKVAIVLVRHLNKASGGNPLYRGGGSIGIVGAVRSALLVAKHPEDDRRRVLAPMKGNLAEPAPSLAFALTGADNGAVSVEYKSETSYTADALLAAPTDPEERSALKEAQDFLRDALKDGPRHGKTVKKEAQEADISDATLRRAKPSVGVRSTKEGDGPWSWALPEEADQGGQET